MKKLVSFLIILFCSTTILWAQSTVKKYIIAGIEVEGAKTLQTPPIIRTTGLFVGQEITVPRPEITAAKEKLWEQGVYGDPKIPTCFKI